MTYGRTGVTLHAPAIVMAGAGLDIKVTYIVARYPLYHLTYAPAEFEVATSNGLGGDTFTRKYIICPLTLTSRSYKILSSTSTLCDLCNCKGVKLLRPIVEEEMHVQENTLLEI